MPCLQPLADGCTGGLPNEDALFFQHATDGVFGEVEVSTVLPVEAIPALKVWPTFTESTLRVHHEFPRSLQAVVRTLEGKWCWSGSLNPGTTELDVANWPSGSYVIQVGEGATREAVQWIKP